MRKIFAGFLFSLIVTSGVFAQSNAVLAGAGASLSIPCLVSCGVHASYERVIIPQLSVSINASVEMYPFALLAVTFMKEPSIFGNVIDAQVHWYPWKKRFHVDMGVGFGNYLAMNCVVLTPGMGWKFDFGEPGGFTMNLGLRGEFFFPTGENIFKNSDKNVELNPFNLGARLSFGYTF